MNITLNQNVQSAIANAIACNDKGRLRDICSRYAIDFEALLQTQEANSKRAVQRSRAHSKESRRNCIIQYLKKNATFKVADVAKHIAATIEKYNQSNSANTQATKNVLRELAEQNVLTYTTKNDVVSIVFRKAE